MHLMVQKCQLSLTKQMDHQQKYGKKFIQASQGQSLHNNPSSYFLLIKKL